MWRISGQGSIYKPEGTRTMEQLPPQWASGLTSCGILENLKARPPKRQPRKEGIGGPEGVRPAASSGT